MDRQPIGAMIDRSTGVIRKTAAAEAFVIRDLACKVTFVPTKRPHATFPSLPIAASLTACAGRVLRQGLRPPNRHGPGARDIVG